MFIWQKDEHFSANVARKASLLARRRHAQATLRYGRHLVDIILSPITHTHIYIYIKHHSLDNEPRSTDFVRLSDIYIDII